jgi:signal transduction histidine kinase
MTRRLLAYCWELSPLRVLLVTLVVIFLAEATIMVGFAMVVGPRRNPALEAVVDASLVTALAAPILSWLIFTPLRRIAQVRGQLLGQAYQLQEDERRRIARDLHDEIGQSFTSLLVGLRLLEQAQSLNDVHQQAGKMRGLGGEIYDEIRRLARGLHPTVLDDLGLEAAIKRLAEDYQLSHNVAIDFSSTGLEGARLNRKIETAVYRIVQESLTNCVKHAQAAHIEVALAREPGLLTAVVADNGRGFPVAEALRPGRTTGLGLSGMKERALLVQGSLDIRSHSNVGTTITLQVPLEA